LSFLLLVMGFLWFLAMRATIASNAMTVRPRRDVVHHRFESAPQQGTRLGFPRHSGP
jgi:hypothetical protein